MSESATQKRVACLQQLWLMDLRSKGKSFDLSRELPGPVPWFFVASLGKVESNTAFAGLQWFGRVDTKSNPVLGFPGDSWMDLGMSIP